MNKVDSSTQPLADPRLEAAAQILNAYDSRTGLPARRRMVSVRSAQAEAMLSEARKQTGADEAFRILRRITEMANYGDVPAGSDAIREARAALAKYEGVG
jgi:hypothetical protein